jgi:hypothetical protein
VLQDRRRPRDYTEPGEYLKNILNENGFNQEKPKISKPKISIDNRGAELVAQAAQTKRSKHYDVRFHYVQEYVLNKEYILEHVATQDNIADIFTESWNKFVLETSRYIVWSRTRKHPRECPSYKWKLTARGEC